MKINGFAVRPGRACWVAAVVSLASCEVSQEQEVALGDQTAQEVSAALPIVDDPYIAGYIAELGDTIAKLTSRRDLDWRFYVVNSHQVNAFALPGGHIYVNRGLIEATDQMYELAGVLGHEIGHVIQRHSVKQMQSQQKIGVVATLACTLTDICNNELGQAAINIGGTAVVARHSRQDEFQADSEAVENVLRAKIDPAGIPVLFETLMEQRQSAPTVVDGWFASHPLEETRVANSLELIEAAGADRIGGLLQDIPSYQEFKRRVARLPEPVIPAERRRERQ